MLWLVLKQNNRTTKYITEATGPTANIVTVKF